MVGAALLTSASSCSLPNCSASSRVMRCGRIGRATISSRYRKIRDRRLAEERKLEIGASRFLDELDHVGVRRGHARSEDVIVATVEFPVLEVAVQLREHLADALERVVQSVEKIVAKRGRHLSRRVPALDFVLDEFVRIQALLLGRSP
jgi:hypothetical protein